METDRSDPVCIPNKEDVSGGVTALDLSRCSLDGDDWEDLERYWGDEKHRVHQLETQLSSSLEKHLLYDDCLNKPYENVDNSFKDENCCYIESSYVRGEDVNDIPTSYVLKGFQPHEFVVIGTYVDKRVIPGFKYRVRQNTSNKYFFSGQAQFLEQIGLGYGKRLTFASKLLNKNENYFWSDSSPGGYGFSVEALSKGNKLSIFDCQTQLEVGYIVVSSIEEQTETHSSIKNNGSAEKEVKVIFTCDVNIKGVHYEHVPATGTATLVKERGSRFSILKSIKLNSFIIENCELQPADF